MFAFSRPPAHLLIYGSANIDLSQGFSGTEPDKNEKNRKRRGRQPAFPFGGPILVFVIFEVVRRTRKKFLSLKRPHRGNRPRNMTVSNE